MKKTVTFERSTSMGTVVRSTVEAVGEGKVRVVDYYRKPRHPSQFKRAKGEEGVILPFEQLGVKEPFEEFFELKGAA